MQLFLIGFMGAGKSYVGSRLAALRAMDFVDLDEQIAAKAQKSIPDIFAQDGEMAFRILEADCLRSLADRKSLLLACGGGTPCFFDNMDWMNAQGLTVFLDAGVELLMQRLQTEMAQRPLLAGKSYEELSRFLEQQLEERRPFYEQAQLVFPLITGKEKVVEELNQKLRKMML